MAGRSNIEIAEALTRKRARILPVLAIVFLAQQITYFSGTGDAVRTVDFLRMGAWLLLSVLLLAGLATGGTLFQSAEVRALMDDEVTREHRRTATVYGFWSAAGTALGLYAVSMFEPLDGREAVHIILTVAIATALLMFAMLERRALRDG